MTDIVRVSGEALVEELAGVAHRIWNQHFPPIIGQDQVDYMVDEFQSIHAITEQIEKGYEYYLLRSEGVAVGYTGLVPEPDRLMISKLYLDLTARGGGLGRVLLDFAIERCRELDLPRIYLTVNRGNTGPIEWYQRRGFVITEEVDIDIGNGFVMDDYLMTLELD